MAGLAGSKPLPPPPAQLDTAPHVLGTAGHGGLALHRLKGRDADGIVTEMHALVGDPPPSVPRFPGPNPVSLERAHLPTLRPDRYWICEKTDGTRCAMLCVTYRGHRLVVLLDRKLTAYVLPLRRVPKALFQGTVLDGELAFDKVSNQHQFMVFDAVMVSGIPVFHKPFSYRLADVRLALRDYRPDAGDGVGVRVKGFDSLARLPEFVGRLDAIRRHFDIDGVVLTPEDGHVAFGRNMRMFKLKAFGGRAAHTVDFLAAEEGGLSVFDAGRHVVVGKIAADWMSSCVPPAPGSVVECTCAEDGTWVPVCIRTDKKTANDLFTYQKTLLNIQEALALEDLARIL